MSDPLDLARKAARDVAYSLLPRVLNGAIDATRIFADDVVRIGVTGLSRAGKTAFLTSVAATLLARDHPRFSLAPMGASEIARFDHPAHLAALAADPPQWPERTNHVSILALNVTIPRGAILPAKNIRLEFLDYPGEWLLDLPLLTQDFSQWSAAILARLQSPPLAAIARDFLAFAHGLPMAAPGDEVLAQAGYGLFQKTLLAARAAGFSFLQPGRHLMPPPGTAPSYHAFFPMTGKGGLRELLASRYGAYVESVRRDLSAPMFAGVDRLIVLADLLSALHDGKDAFEDARAALGAAAGALRFDFNWLSALASLAKFQLPPRVISRIAFAATKSDHVGERQRGNLKNLMRVLTTIENSEIPVAYFAIASVRCTTDYVHSLGGSPVSAVRGVMAGSAQALASFPGEIPDQPPGGEFWAHPFLALPDFIPMRLPENGRRGVPHIGVEELLRFILPDILT